MLLCPYAPVVRMLINPQIAILRIALALVFGAIIGVEREWRHKNAGIKTNTLVALGSAAFAMMSDTFGPNNHNPALLAGFADRILVLYAGRVIELGPAQGVLASPKHPYTRSLFQSIPPLASAPRQAGKKKLPAISGDSFSSSVPREGCPFEPRCPERMDICKSREPGLVNLSETHTVSCFRYEGQ